jgi:hypothetical protein
MTTDVAGISRATALLGGVAARRLRSRHRPPAGLNRYLRRGLHNRAGTYLTPLDLVARETPVFYEANGAVRLGPTSFGGEGYQVNMFDEVRAVWGLLGPEQ